MLLFYLRDQHHLLINASVDYSSQNGSPILVNDDDNAGPWIRATVKKPQPHGNNSVFHTSNVVELNLAGGERIVLDSADSVHQLNDDLKLSALSQIKALKEQMDGLLKELGECEDN
jgi:hypothetical protein